MVPGDEDKIPIEENSMHIHDTSMDDVNSVGIDGLCTLTLNASVTEGNGLINLLK